MGKALEVLLGGVVAAGTTPTAITMASGDSLTIKDPRGDDPVHLLNCWTHSQGDGQLRLRGSRFHDSTVGIRLLHENGRSHPLFPAGFKEKMHSGQIITAELTGSATAGDREFAAFLVRYMNLPGVDVQFVTPEQVMERMVHLHAVDQSLTLAGGANWDGSEAINAENNAFKGRTDYAILGYMVDAICAGIAYSGPDTGNMRVGGPADPEYNDLTREWFVWLSRMYGEPLIPVINADNRNNTFIESAQNEDAANIEVSTIYAELASA